MLTGVDHLVIRCSNPIELIDTVKTALDVPVLIPAQDYGDFCSGIIRLGNLDIEFLKIGAEAVPNPYFYGIAFASNQGIWQTTAWLKTLQIPHTLPIHTTVKRNGRQWGWSTILLDGFLDEPIPAPYSLGLFSGNSLTARGASAFSSTLMKVPIIRRSTSSKAGKSMCFVCHYDQDLSRLRSEATETLVKREGGKNQIVAVEAIVIESNRAATSWKQLLATKQIDNPKVEIQSGTKNRIQEVVIKTQCSEPMPPMQFGEAVFSFQSK